MVISVAEAQKMILESVTQQTASSSPLEEAAGFFLAEAVFSPHSLPFFDNSAMDGYTLCFEETQNATLQTPCWFDVQGEVSAGQEAACQVGTHQAMRIFTGAPIPPGADSVIRQEDVRVEDKKISITRPVLQNENIRKAGEEIQKGGLILKAGQKLSPASIGLLASVGLREVAIVSPPRVSLLVTGSEIVQNISNLKPGKIFDSNSFALTAALKEMGLKPSFTNHVPDAKESLRLAFIDAFERSDFLIVTGGVSVGDFDYVKDVAALVGIQPVFWGVKQKPGKPFFFGMSSKNPKFLFGLPGNPASALVCFYEYIRPALLKAMGSGDLFLPLRHACLQGPIRKKAGLAHFLKGRFSKSPDGNAVAILDNQGSHMMTSFADANCLAFLVEERASFEKGEVIPVHLLPQ